MSKWGNLEGTLRDLFSLGKGSNEVALRSASGVVQARNNGGQWIELAMRVEAQSANFTAEYGKIYIVSNDISVQLPAPILDKVIVVKLASSNTVTLVRNGTEQIEGEAASKVLNSTRQAVKLINDGTNWFFI